MIWIVDQETVRGCLWGRYGSLQYVLWNVLYGGCVLGCVRGFMECIDDYVGCA